MPEGDIVSRIENLGLGFGYGFSERELGQNKWLDEVLGQFEQIPLPDSWLVAGCIAQTIWNLSFEQPAEFGLKDVDLIYFDEEDLSLEAEIGHERRLRDLFRMPSDKA